MTTVNPYIAKMANYQDSILESISHLENAQPSRSSAYLAGALPFIGANQYAKANSPQEHNPGRTGAIALGTLAGGLGGVFGMNRLGRLLNRSGILKRPLGVKGLGASALAGGAVGGGETAYQASEQDRLDQLRTLYSLRG